MPQFKWCVVYCNQIVIIMATSIRVFLGWVANPLCIYLTPTESILYCKFAEWNLFNGFWKRKRNLVRLVVEQGENTQPLGHNDLWLAWLVQLPTTSKQFRQLYFAHSISLTLPFLGLKWFFLKVKWGSSIALNSINRMHFFCTEACTRCRKQANNASLFLLQWVRFSLSDLTLWHFVKLTFVDLLVFTTKIMFFSNEHSIFFLL